MNDTSKVVDTLRDIVGARIMLFQDIVGWQKGESRNALISEIAMAVDQVLADAENICKQKENLADAIMDMEVK